ncbi:amino acid permease, partial [Gammaproteobacteria bacterium]|nr:amino acid permease [Gammaproteobacteria bacterium]
NLHYAGDTGPFTGLVAALGLYWFVNVIYAGAIVAPFGTGFVFTASTARIGYGLSQIGFMPKTLSKLTKKGVPMRSIMVNFFIGLLLFLPFPAWQKLVSFIISCFILSYIIGPIALVSLRKTQPNTPRPFFLPYATTISLISFYICNLLIFWTGWETVSKMMIALSTGLIFFGIHCINNKNVIWQKELQKAWWILPYFGILTVISYLGTFGHGKEIISFGLDFAIIGILTAFIFYFIIKTKKHEQ